MKKISHTNREDTGFMGSVDQAVTDEMLLASQLRSQELFLAVSAVISGVEGMYECFGVKVSGILAHDDKYKGMESFVQVHGVLPETGLRDRVPNESRFLLRDLLYSNVPEINTSNDFGLVALHHHFHSQPLFQKMLAAKEVCQLNTLASVGDKTASAR